MKRSLLPLNALRAFDAAARHMSFKKAADDLSVTPAAISQQIRSLEDILGVELFKRTNRSLILTESAQLALAPLKEGFEKMEEAVDTLTSAKTTKTLRISVTPSIAAKWLVPRLVNFYTRYPDSIVKVNANMAIIDFKAEDIDLAIRYGNGEYPGVHSQLLMRGTVSPVCSPTLLSEGAAINAPADVLKHTLIHEDGYLEGDNTPTWAMWLKAAGIEMPEGLPALHFNSSALAVEAAAAGRGIALARSIFAADDLKSGRLVKPFLSETPVDFGYHIVCPPEKLKSERVRNFIDWLMEEAQ